MNPPESIAAIPVGLLIKQQTARLATVTTLMLRDQPFFAPGILQMKHHILPPDNPRVPTFSTNGRDLFVNAGFAHHLEGGVVKSG